MATEAELVEQACEMLAARLPDGWSTRCINEDGDDAVFAFDNEFGSGGGSVIVEAKEGFAPADVERLLGGLTRRLRDTSAFRSILLVSDFLSPRTRHLLRDEDINYLDLTGNIRLVTRNPPMFIEAAGADRRPGRRSGTTRTSELAGVKIGQLVRFLTEVAPPYGVTDIEAATEVSRGYVSKVLDRLAEEALIQREPRGPVEQVDWPALLRTRGRSVDLLKTNTAQIYVTPNGATAALEKLTESPLSEEVVVTGSFAAVRIAPVAAPTLLALYVDPSGQYGFDDVRDQLGLLPTNVGADLVLLRPPNMRVLDGPRVDDGVRFANIPQLVIDCLGGTGRMPSEGEAIIDWMTTNEAEWRFPSLDAYLDAGR
jgi:hypothetical protein